MHVFSPRFAARDPPGGLAPGCASRHPGNRSGCKFRVSQNDYRRYVGLHGSLLITKTVPRPFQASPSSAAEAPVAAVPELQYSESTAAKWHFPQENAALLDSRESTEPLELL
jgi:hypothetical protein